MDYIKLFENFDDNSFFKQVIEKMEKTYGKFTIVKDDMIGDKYCKTLDVMIPDPKAKYDAVLYKKTGKGWHDVPAKMDLEIYQFPGYSSVIAKSEIQGDRGSRQKAVMNDTRDLQGFQISMMSYTNYKELIALQRGRPSDN